MYSLSLQAIQFLRYWLTASNGRGHGVHSPFVFDFITKVLNDPLQPEIFARIEGLRQRLKSEQGLVHVEDLGAGSGLDNAQQRKIGDIARHAAKPPKYGRLLHRIARHYHCEKVLELGTSLGLSTAYLAAADPVRQLITLEGAPAVAGLALQNLQQLGLENVRLIQGNFDQTLTDALAIIGSPDLVFVDGNHRQQPTLRYFRQCLEVVSDQAIFVFDDIHWSPEMEAAWEEIKAHEAVTCSIDLFFLGIVLFRPSFREKQHFTIRY